MTRVTEKFIKENCPQLREQFWSHTTAVATIDGVWNDDPDKVTFLAETLTRLRWQHGDVTLSLYNETAIFYRHKTELEAMEREIELAWVEAHDEWVSRENEAAAAAERLELLNAAVAMKDYSEELS